MPWREPLPDGSYDPYHILVSEMMLQQTQVSRVVPKYEAFLAVFPDIKSLAEAKLAEVLKVWSGLGYNRRAKYLHDAAKLLVSKNQPWKYDDLVVCKGIGSNTAKAVLVYAYDLPEVFIETNIRTVFIHYFFPKRTNVTDKEILELHARTLDTKLPRACYWALMDIGAFIKATAGNAGAKSQAYKKQSRFEGSLRQLRGNVLKALSHGPKLFEQFEITDTVRFQEVLTRLQGEKLIHKKGKKFFLGSE